MFCDSKLRLYAVLTNSATRVLRFSGFSVIVGSVGSGRLIKEKEKVVEKRGTRILITRRDFCLNLAKGFGGFGRRAQGPANGVLLGCG